MPTRNVRDKRVSKNPQAILSGPSVRVIVTNADYGRICKAFVRRLPAQTKSRLSMVTCPSWSDVDLRTGDKSSGLPTFFVSRVADIPDRIPVKARTRRQSKHLLFAEGLPVEAIASRLPRLGIRDIQRLHIARAREPSQISKIVFRLVKGITQPNEPERILDAWIENRDLALLAPSFKRLIVPLERLQKYLGNVVDQARAFEIDEDGSFLYWPHADVHLGWNQFFRLIDATASLAAKQRRNEFNREYGAAIRVLREEAALRQADIEGTTQRNLRRVEHGRIPATKATLQALADAHGLPLEDYLERLAKRLKM
jgi:hypothetical protein